MLAGTRDDQARADAAKLFVRCEQFDVTMNIADRAADLRRNFRLKLPDALILATALEWGHVLVTRDGDFPVDHLSVRRPYRLG